MKKITKILLKSCYSLKSIGLDKESLSVFEIAKKIALDNSLDPELVETKMNEDISDEETVVYPDEELKSRRDSLLKGDFSYDESNPIYNIFNDYLQKVYFKALRSSGNTIDHNNNSQVEIRIGELNNIAEQLSRVDSEFNIHKDFYSLLTSGDYGADPVNPDVVCKVLQEKIFKDLLNGEYYLYEDEAEMIGEWSLTPVQIYAEKFYKQDVPEYSVVNIEREMNNLSSLLSGANISYVD